MDIELGCEVMDKVTGFKGTVTGKAEYLHNNPPMQGRVERCSSDGRLQEVWFPIERLEVMP